MHANPDVVAVYASPRITLLSGYISAPGLPAPIILMTMTYTPVNVPVITPVLYPRYMLTFSQALRVRQ